MMLCLCLLLAACQPAASSNVAVLQATETPSLAPTSVATATLGPTATSQPEAAMIQVEWMDLQPPANLAQDPSWACVGGVEVVDGGLRLEAGGDYLTVVHERGPVIEFEDDFGVAATLHVLEGEWGAFTLVGALPQGAWWKGIKRLDLSLGGGQLGLVVWDGSKDSPAFSTSFAAAGTSNEAQIQFRKQGDQLLIWVNGSQVGRLDDKWDMFPDNRVYLGANIPPGGKTIIEEIGVETQKDKESMVRVVTPGGALIYAPTTPSLRELADARGLKIGAAVASGPLRCETAYAEALAHEFNMLTTENAMKFGPIHPQPDRYAFQDADDIVAFAEQHDMQVRGHALIWHQQVPQWIEQGDWTRETLLTVMGDHISTVVGRYKGRVQVWDVVNEAIADQSASLRSTLWHKAIGPEYLDLAFQFAHQADPDALLFYNDYSAEGMSRKSDAVYELVKGMLERGVPVHGVGLQMHIISHKPPDWADVQENIGRLNALGLEVHITELDVRILGEPTEVKLAQQAQVYRDVLDTCLMAEKCTAFVTWGFTDRYSWVPGFFEGFEAALPFDETYQPKPAYHALQSALGR
ncbi:MAG: endo-1,4-beta-xylanase [Anaerolineae bacterium]|nr:endo-1,4-beta-xylanase [Anaerolineae bacterium]